MEFFRNLYEGDPRGKSQYLDSQIMAILYRGHNKRLQTEYPHPWSESWAMLKHAALAFSGWLEKAILA